MPGRVFASPAYRYGFNGQEKDNEVSGNENSLTAEYWEYDSRLARRWNIDPVVITSISGYSTFNNNAIQFCDPDGLFASKEKAEKVRLRSIAAGNDAGPLYRSGKEWGFNTSRRDGQDYVVTSVFKRQHFTTSVGKAESQSFWASLSPIDESETYLSISLKTTIDGG